MLLRWALGAMIGRNTAVMSLKKRPRNSRAYWGMVLAHLGVAVFVVGVTLVKGYESDRDVNLRVGESVELAGYSFRFAGLSPVQGPNYTASQARIEVTREGRPVTVMRPERRHYPVQDQVMTEAAIHPRLTRDLYVSLGDPLDDGAWLIKVQHKPFIDWIWAGCLLMAFGGVLAVTDRRYRVGAARREEAAPEPAVA